MANTVYDLFLSILDVHAPLKKRKGIQRCAPAPWLSARIRKLMRDRDKYKVLAEEDQQLWPRYRKLRNRVTAELHKSVKTYYQGLIDETSNNPKEMWKSVNKVLNKDKTRNFPSSVTYKGQNLETHVKSQRHSMITS